MDATTVSLEPVDERALDYVERLLADNGLPTGDVRSNPDCFYVARADGDRVGVGGIEPHGTAGLLRSVVVEDAARGNGYGTALCSALETAAVEDGLDSLYLLTTTATGFFADRGYDRVDRDGVPAAIRETEQFAELCPASADCMRKSL